MDNEYTELILEYYKHPIHYGRITKPDLEAHGGNVSCSDHIILTMSFTTFEGPDRKGKANEIEYRIKEIKFEGDGCAISRAGACLLTERVEGRSITDALETDAESIVKELGVTSPGRLKCALLAVNTLKKALGEWKKNPKKGLVLKGIEI